VSLIAVVELGEVKFDSKAALYCIIWPNYVWFPI